MKKIFTIILSFYVSSLFAQSFTAAKDTAMFSGRSTLEEINDRIVITNQTASVLTLRCIRTIVDMPTQWETSLCHQTICFPNATDSIDFTVPANGTNYLLIHYYLHNTVGEGTVTLKVTEVNNPQNQRVLTYIGTGFTTLGLESNKKSNMEVFPNPVQDMVNIKLSPEIRGDYKIFNALGKCVMAGDINGGSENYNIDFSAADSGIYFLTVNSSGNAITRKIIKK
jgi:hypothetical protein